MNTLGRLFRVSIFGESHGNVVGVLVDGVPAGIPFSERDVQPELDRRRPGQSLLTTQRREGDVVIIETGVLNGRTTGSPVLMVIRNADRESGKYEATKDTPRPGHSDYPARAKFAGYNDYRGGGMFSGRLTACTVMAGALAKAVLEPLGVAIAAHTTQIAGVKTDVVLDVDGIRDHVESNPVRTADPAVAQAMADVILAARNDRDSVGGVIEVVAEGVPLGIGEPVAGSLESELARAVFTIPATKGVEFGDGFAIAAKRGSEVVDPYIVGDDGRIHVDEARGNHNGGILGGIATGATLRYRVALKPTSSIPRNLPTVNLVTGEAADVLTKGRHDPCIVPRAVPVLEAVTAIVLVDALLIHRGIQGDLPEGAPPMRAGGDYR